MTVGKEWTRVRLKRTGAPVEETEAYWLRIPVPGEHVYNERWPGGPWEVEMVRHDLDAVEIEVVLRGSSAVTRPSYSAPTS